MLRDLSVFASAIVLISCCAVLSFHHSTTITTKNNNNNDRNHQVAAVVLPPHLQHFQHIVDQLPLHPPEQGKGGVGDSDYCSHSDTICFYDSKMQYYEFCNLYLATIELEESWPAVEHFYQAHKFNSTFRDVYETIRTLSTGYQAWSFGQKMKNFTRPDWEDVRDGVMMAALVAKYQQHPELASVLKNTGSKRLVERSNDDDYWGDGKYRNGTNRLGKFLMMVRDDVLSASQIKMNKGFLKVF